MLSNKNRLKTLAPRGTTPIAYTLEKCADDFPTPSSASVRNIIILITDGIEECDGDPCAVSLALQKKGIVLKPFVIGVGLDQSYINSFGCIGKFYDASSETSFKNRETKTETEREREQERDLESERREREGRETRSTAHIHT